MNTNNGLTRRLIKEIDRLNTEPPEGCEIITPFQNNPRYFLVLIEGAEKTPYENGLFKVEMFIPVEYPMVAPKLRLLTRIYSPNFDKIGRNCMELFRDKWSPALNLRCVLMNYRYLLCEPNPTDCMDFIVGDFWLHNEEKAISKAKKYCKLYAKPLR